MSNNKLIESEWSNPIHITTGMTVPGGSNSLISKLIEMNAEGNALLTTEFIDIHNNYVYYLVSNSTGNPILKRFHLTTPDIKEVIPTTGMHPLLGQFTQLIKHNNKVYVIGGMLEEVGSFNYGADDTVIRIFDLDTFDVQHFSLKSLDPNIKGSVVTSACIIGEYLYIGNPSNNTVDPNIYKVHLVNKTIETFINISDVTHHHAYGILCNFDDNYLYFIGGQANNTLSSFIDRYDLTTKELTSYPLNRKFMYTSHYCKKGNDIYFAGTYIVSDISHEIFKFNKDSKEITTPYQMMVDGTPRKVYAGYTFLLDGIFYSHCPYEVSENSQGLYSMNFLPSCKIYKVEITKPTITEIKQDVVEDRIEILHSAFSITPAIENHVSTDIEMWLNNDPTNIYTQNTSNITSTYFNNFKTFPLGDYSFRIRFRGNKSVSDWSAPFSKTLPVVCEKVTLTNKTKITNFRSFNNMFMVRDTNKPDELTSIILFDKIEDIFFYLQNTCGFSIKDLLIYCDYRFGDTSNDYVGLCSNTSEEYIKLVIDTKSYILRYVRYAYTTGREIPTFAPSHDFPIDSGHYGNSTECWICESVLSLEFALEVMDRIRPEDPWSDDDIYKDGSLFQEFPYIYTRKSLPLGYFEDGYSKYFRNGEWIVCTDRDDYINKHLEDIPTLANKINDVDGFVVINRHVGYTTFSYAYHWYIPFKVKESYLPSEEIVISSKQNETLSLPYNRLGISSPQIQSPADLTRLPDNGEVITLTVAAYDNWYNEPMECLLVKAYHHTDETRIIACKKFLPGEPLTFDFLTKTIDKSYLNYRLRAQYRSANYASYWSYVNLIYPPFPSYIGKPKSLFPETLDLKSCFGDKYLILKVKPTLPEEIKYGNLWSEALSYIQYQLADNPEFTTTLINVNNSNSDYAKKHVQQFTYSTNFTAGTKRYIRYKKYYSNPSFNSDWSETLVVDQTLPENPIVEVETTLLTYFDLNVTSFKIAKYNNHVFMFCGSRYGEIDKNKKLYLIGINLADNVVTNHPMPVNNINEYFSKINCCYIYNDYLYSYVMTIEDSTVPSENYVYNHKVLCINLTTKATTHITPPFPRSYHSASFLIGTDIYFFAYRETNNEETSIWKMSLVDNSFVKIIDCPSDLKRKENNDGTVVNNKIYMFSYNLDKIYEYDPINNPTNFNVILDLTNEYATNNLDNDIYSPPIGKAVNGKLLKFRNNFYFLQQTPTDSSMNGKNYKYNLTHDYTALIFEPSITITENWKRHVPFLNNHNSDFLFDEDNGYFYGICDLRNSEVFGLVKKRFPGHTT